jgi:starch-binding outer membrane protein, SusD/RagB family
MKKYLILLLLIVSQSCDNLFHDEDNKYLVINSEQEKIDILNGIYSLLVKVYDMNYFTALARSDDINVYYNYSFSYSGGSCTTGGGSTIDFTGITGNIYLNFYTAIISINRLLPALSEPGDNKLIGELYFLRAYCYFQLARFFGTPPLVTDIEVNYFIEKPTYKEVYEFIQADMLKALELLPETYAEARVPGETPNKGTAKALLAEIYLAMAGFPVNDISKYAESARLAGEVIENAGEYNYALLDDLTNLWKNDNRHNPETVFGLYFDEDGEETQNTIGASSICTYFAEDPLEVCGGYHTEFKFFNTFPNNYRRYNSFVTGHYVQNIFDTISGNEESLEFEPYDPLVNPCDFVGYVVSLKWLDRSTYDRGEARWNVKNQITLYLLRYAQTLLTYAEAKARSGNLDESCFDVVNQVRRRANNLDIYNPCEFDLLADLTTEQFLDSVVWERAWELSTEPQGRWFDIIRLDLKDKMAEFRYPQDFPTNVDDQYLNEDWYFYLIPQDDRWINPNFSDEE